MKKWEYQIIKDWEDGNPDSVAELNDFGEEGWELILVLETPVDFGTGPIAGGLRWFFKREKHDA